jgi:hypothetical protein
MYVMALSRILVSWHVTCVIVGALHGARSADLGTAILVH